MKFSFKDRPEFKKKILEFMKIADLDINDVAEKEVDFPRVLKGKIPGSILKQRNIQEEIKKW